MKISNKISDEQRAYINNLIISGAGQVKKENIPFDKYVTHELIEDKGFIIEARKIIRANA